MVYGYDNYRWMNVNIESAILTPEFYEPSAEQIIIWLGAVWGEFIGLFEDQDWRLEEFWCCMTNFNLYLRVLSFF